MTDLPDSIGTIARQSTAAADVELDSSPQVEFHIAAVVVVVVEYSPCTDCPSSFPFATADCITRLLWLVCNTATGARQYPYEHINKHDTSTTSRSSLGLHRVQSCSSYMVHTIKKLAKTLLNGLTYTKLYW